MRSAAASAISHDASAALLATTKFQSDCAACRSTSQTAMAATASQPIAAARDRVAHRGTRPLSAWSRPGPAPVAARTERRRQGRAERRCHERPPHADERERPEHDAREEERQRHREDASRQPRFDASRAARSAAESPRTTQIAAKMPEKTTRCSSRLRSASEGRGPQAEREHERQCRQRVRQRHGERREHARGKVA